MKILITTHSSRFFDSDRANLNSLNKRFESRTLENLPDLKTFGPWQQAIAVKGKIVLLTMALALLLKLEIKSKDPMVKSMN